MPKFPPNQAHDNLQKNLEEVIRLLQIHTILTGSGPGYKHKVEVLNKSAIVLLVACWESFVEDLAERAFDNLINKTKDPSLFPKKVLGHCGKSLKDEKNDTSVWRLAGQGWKTVLKDYKLSILKKYTGSLNTPDTKQIENIYECLLGMKKLSSCWRWKGASSESSVKKLNTLIKLRGEIAHRVEVAKKITKMDVRKNSDFVYRLAVLTSNSVRNIVFKITKKNPWKKINYEKIAE
jgi:HEPN superfamily RiboL-PSP-like protein